MLRAEIGEAAGAAEADAADARAEVLHLRDALSQLEAALRDSEAKRCGLPETRQSPKDTESTTPRLAL